MRDQMVVYEKPHFSQKTREMGRPLIQKSREVGHPAGIAVTDYFIFLLLKGMLRGHLCK